MHGTVCVWNVPGRYGPYGELFFFLLKKEPRVFSELVRFGPASQPKKSEHVSWSVLHMMGAEISRRSDSGSSVSSSSLGENNVGNGALFVIRLRDPATQSPSSFKTGRWQR